MYAFFCVHFFRGKTMKRLSRHLSALLGCMLLASAFGCGGESIKDVTPTAAPANIPTEAPTETPAPAYIGKVIQKTFIEVDESGTKAGAATVVSMLKNTAIMIDKKYVRIDRPFVYMIVDTENFLPLFLGVECSTTTEK